MTSFLERFRFKGGFNQLLSLIETSPIEGQGQLLKLIESEDPSWAKLLKIKIVTVEKIFSFETATLAKIFTRIPIESARSLLANQKESVAKKLLAALPKQISSELKNLNVKDFSDGEFHAARVQAIHVIRQMQRDGEIEADPFIPMPEKKVG